MKYLILIYGNPATRKAWREFSDAERAEGWQAHADLRDRLVASGELIVSEALADPGLGTGVSAREGTTMTTDGPFAEAKEYLAGFYLVECESAERAVEYAAQAPEAELGLVEVRPVMELGGPEM